MRPAPGWCLVKPVVAEERFAGARIIVPAMALDNLTRWQAEVVTVGEPGTCIDEDCGRPHHVEAVGPFGWRGSHCLPLALRRGAWVVLEPRGRVSVPGEREAYLVAQDAIWAVLEP